MPHISVKDLESSDAYRKKARGNSSETRTHKQNRKVTFTHHSSLKRALSQSPNMPPSLDWIAGFFDGEGTVTVRLSRRAKTKYGYLFRPYISVSQKDRAILEAVQQRLRMGRLCAAGGSWRLDIRSHAELRCFIGLFSSRVVLKREQLQLLSEALKALPRRNGWQYWASGLPRTDALRLLEIVARLRESHCKTGGHPIDLRDVRGKVLAFDEEQHRQQLRNSRRNAALRLHARGRTPDCAMS